MAKKYTYSFVAVFSIHSHARCVLVWGEVEFVLSHEILRCDFTVITHLCIYQVKRNIKYAYPFAAVFSIHGHVRCVLVRGEEELVLFHVILRYDFTVVTHPCGALCCYSIHTE